MSTLRTVGVGVIVLVLSISLLASNAAIAADRTVLSGPFVKSALEEEDAYATLQDVAVDIAVEQVGEGQELPIDLEPLVDDIVRAEYLETQAETNIDRLYGYLHGDREELTLALNLTPIKTRIPALIEAEIENRTVGELVELAGDAANQSVTVANFTLSVATFGEMAASESEYRETRQDLRDTIRERVLDELVQQAFDSASNDQLLALVIEDYNPDDYSESEKEAMVADREADIRQAIRQRIVDEQGDEIDRRIDDRLADMNEQITEQITAAVSEGDLPTELQDGLTTFIEAGVDGLTTDISYDTYVDRLDDAKSALATGLAALAEERIDEEVPDRLALTDELPADTRSQLEQVRTVVGLIDLLSLLLPLLAIGLIGLIYFITRSPPITALGAGIGLLIGGLPGVTLAAILPPRLRDVVADVDAPQAITDLALGLVDQVIGALMTQSILLTVLGGGLIGGAVYLRRRD